MNRTAFTVGLIALFGALGLTAGVVVKRWATPDAPAPALAAMVETSVIGSPLPAFSIPDLTGVSRGPGNWSGKVMVVNFWATWCPPCRREMPGFVELQKRYGDKGLQFVGIAVDNADAVREFVSKVRPNYPILLGGDPSLDLSTRLGNRYGSLPFTAIIDRSGRVRHVQAGEIDKGALERLVRPLLG